MDNPLNNWGSSDHMEARENQATLVILIIILALLFNKYKSNETSNILFLNCNFKILKTAHMNIQG
jgi:hypothetical protein